MQILFLFFLILKVFSEITFHFKKVDFKKEFNITNFIEYLYRNQIESDVNIGNPNQKIPLLIQQSTFCIYITSSKCEGNIIKFNESLSSTYNSYDNKLIQYTYQDFTFALKSYDYFIKEKINFEKINFLLVSQYKFNISGVLGLRIFNEDKDYNLIYQLKKNKIIDSYNFYIKYENEKEGKLYIGNLLNENIKFTKEILDNKNRFGIVFDNIFSGDKELLFCYSKGFFQIENGFIRGNKEYKIEVEKHFFKEQIILNKCYSQLLINKWKEENIFFYCNDNVDLAEFKPLKFYLKSINLTFEFNSKDLFYKYDNKYYFLVYFTNKENVEWIFGEPFFKKYIIGFNQDKKVIQFLEGNFEKSNNLNYIKNTIIIISILFIIILIICIYSKVKKTKIKNQKNKNEEYYSIN